MMSWTADKKDELGRLAASGIGGPAVAAALGVSDAAMRAKCRKLRISIIKAPHNRLWKPNEQKTRERWAELIGPMKQAFRREIAEP